MDQAAFAAYEQSYFPNARLHRLQYTISFRLSFFSLQTPLSQGIMECIDFSLQIYYNKHNTSEQSSVYPMTARFCTQTTVVVQILSQIQKNLHVVPFLLIFELL